MGQNLKGRKHGARFPPVSTSNSKKTGKDLRVVCDPKGAPKAQWQRDCSGLISRKFHHYFGTGHHVSYHRGSSPRPSMLGQRPSTLTALCSWAAGLFLIQVPSAGSPAPSVLCGEPDLNGREQMSWEMRKSTPLPPLVLTSGLGIPRVM